MSDAKHTPGPWHWNGIAAIWNTVGHEGEVEREVYVASVVTDYGDNSCVESIPVREANARLIAAAPDLLSALELISNLDAGEASHIARAVVAKVQGNC